MITPYIDILRRLATQVNQDLGSHQGTEHTSPNLEKDIAELMLSLAKHIACLNRMTAPLHEFNIQLACLQRRCTVTPVVGPPYTFSYARGNAAAPILSASPQAAATSVSMAEKSPCVPQSTLTPMEFTHEEDNVDTMSEADYWDIYPWDEEDRAKRIPFSLEDEADVALDMDDLSTMYED